MDVAVLEGQEAREQRKRVTSMRRQFWLTVVLGTVGVLAAIAVSAAVGGAAGVSIVWAAVVLAAGLAPRAASLRRRDVPPPPPPAPVAASEPGAGPLRIENVAFSTHAPKPWGWRRDAGVLLVGRDGVVLRGLRTEHTITGRPTAALHDSRWCYWPMIRISGTDTDGQPITVLAVPDGMPRSKFATTPEAMAAKARAIVYAVEVGT